MSNHIRKGQEINVCDFHVKQIEENGFELVHDYEIQTSRNRFGENSDLRCSCEHIFAFKKRKMRGENQMVDREKIIKAWENVLSRDPLDVPWELIDDTLVLLKEQTEQLELLKEQAEHIDRLERDLAITTNNLNYYINGND